MEVQWKQGQTTASSPLRANFKLVNINKAWPAFGSPLTQSEEEEEEEEVCVMKVMKSEGFACSQCSSNERLH